MERRNFELAMRGLGFTDVSFSSWSEEYQKYVLPFINDRWEGWKLARQWYRELLPPPPDAPRLD